MMNQRVLVVDDDISVLETIQKILTHAGFRVDTAENGNECLEILEKGFSGLILMDVVMPKMDGWDTIEEIVNRDLVKNTIIVMLTGELEPSKKMDHLKEYVLDYITKPFDYKNFVNIVREYLSYLS
jgi:DNA-binding response OmpR family regulator